MNQSTFGPSLVFWIKNDNQMHTSLHRNCLIIRDCFIFIRGYPRCGEEDERLQRRYDLSDIHENEKNGFFFDSIVSFNYSQSSNIR